jgi:capsular polysaccharide transport system ATP-binding protein
VVLDNVTVEFPTGRNVGILGNNGAGKSTLVRMLSGTELPDTGEIERDGLVSFPLGFASTFHPELTGRENVEFIARLYSDQISEVVNYVDDFAELGPYFDAPTKTYSSGMLSKLAFGACLAIDFDVYLVDEVTEVGDQYFRKKALNAFQERAAHSDIILVSHNFHTMKQYCEIGAVLMDGKLDFYETLDAAIFAFESNLIDV